MRLAVIDLGTNTCNLLIVEICGREYEILHQSKLGVNIGEAGIHKKRLTGEAFDRARKAMKIHQQVISGMEVDEVIALATSAIRDADNKSEFSKYLLEKTGIRLQVISGDEEARLIFSGVKLALKNIPNNSLILDIGGGSNEFILPGKTSISWKKSFPLGMSRVIEQFQFSDPILPEETSAIENYFRKGLESLWSETKNKSLNQIIGCSGAFDTMADLIDQTAPGSKARIRQSISIIDFNRVYHEVIRSTKKEREQMIGMEPLRIEMIVPAFIFIRLVAQKLKIEKIIQTDFALREGVLAERICN